MRRLIRTDGTEEDLPIGLSMDEICKRIGADLVDTFLLRHMGQPLHVMIVDDAGWETKVVESGSLTMLVPTKARRPLNARATELYLANCRPGATHQIVGDVVVVPDQDFA